VDGVWSVAEAIRPEGRAGAGRVSIAQGPGSERAAGRRRPRLTPRCLQE